MISLLLAACTEDKTYSSYDRDEDDLIVEARQQLRGDEIPLLGGDVVQPFPGPGVALGDLDGDGYLDLVLAAGTPQSAAFRNDGAGTLVVDAAFTADGGPLPGANTVAVADLEGDGDLDLFLGTPDDDRLLMNDGHGAFTSVVLSAEGHTTTSAVFADLDGDGDLDLLCTRHSWPVDLQVIVSGAPTEDPSTLYMNVDGAWVEDPDRLPFEARKLYAHHGVVVDGDRDGDLDLYLASDWGLWNGPNTWLDNDGYGFFSLGPAEGLDVEMSARGIAMGDIGTDARPDFYVTGIGPPALLESVEEGGWTDHTAQHGANVPSSATHATSWGTTTVDVDGDGLLDIAIAFGKLFIAPDFGDGENYKQYFGADPEAQADVLLVNNTNGRFSDRSDAVGFNLTTITKSVVVGDLDRDGRPDLVTAGYLDLALVPFAQVWHVDGGWGPGVTVQFEGPTPVGTRVEVVADGDTTVRWLAPSTSYASSAPEVYVGTRDSVSASSLSVTWLDGTTSDLGAVDVGTIVRATR